MPSGETKESEESTTKGSGRQQDTGTSGGNNIENVTERGLEDENDNRDRMTRVTKTMRDKYDEGPGPENDRDNEGRLSDTAKT